LSPTLVINIKANGTFAMLQRFPFQTQRWKMTMLAAENCIVVQGLIKDSVLACSSYLQAPFFLNNVMHEYLLFMAIYSSL
jgi:hypothetical protein